MNLTDLLRPKDGGRMRNPHVMAPTADDGPYRVIVTYQDATDAMDWTGPTPFRRSAAEDVPGE